MRKHSICLIACIVLMMLCFCCGALAKESSAVFKSDTKVYQYPSKSSKSISVPKGMRVKVTGYSNGWCQLKRGKVKAYVQSKYLTSASASKIDKVLKTALDQLGKAYGRNPPRKFDCSALVQYCFGKHGYRTRSTAASISKDNRYPKVSRSNLKKGDIICFDSNGDKRCDHVAIYLGKDYMVEASFLAQRVRVKKMNSWYKSHTMFARRVS